MEEGDLSSSSLISSISAVSSIHHPKPPGGPKPSSQGFSRTSKMSGKVVRSPYFATSTPFPKKQKVHTVSGGSCCSSYDGVKVFDHNGVSVREVWGSPPSRKPHPSLPIYLQSLMKTPGFSTVVSSAGTKKRKRNGSRSGASGRGGVEAPVAAQSPVVLSVSGQMDAIELRDEVVRLRKEMNTLTKERDVAKAQQVRLSKEIQRKDKQIEDLISTGHISTQDATRSLASGNSSSKSSKSGTLITSLRQKAHNTERALREKERELAELKKSVGATQLREMELQAETYYREICRLNHLIDQQSATNDEQFVSPRSAREAQIKLKALNQATVKMSAQLESLEEENSRLKRKIDGLQSDSVYNASTIGSSNLKEVGTRGAIVDRYQDHNRSQMLSAIVALEMQYTDLQKNVESVEREKTEAGIAYEQKIKELRQRLTDSSNKITVLKNQAVTSSDMEAKLKNVIQKLKDDRTHYRKAAELTQSELEVMQEQLQKEELSKEDLTKELQALQDQLKNEMMAIEHARKLSKKQSKVFTPDKEKKENAASTIQQSWRRKQAISKQEKRQRETEDAIINIQSVLRGHLARKKILSQATSQVSIPLAVRSVEEDKNDDSEGSDSSEAIEIIQSAMKGYLTRQMALQDLKSFSVSEGRQVHEDENCKSNLTSSLLNYNPPLEIKVNQLNDSLQSLKHKNKITNFESPWKLYHSGLDHDPVQHQLNSGPYFSSTDSDQHDTDPDRTLLMDELS